MARDISDWLEGLGLDKYSALFADNDIGFDILPDLSQELLKELGVSSFGDRVRLLKAVETLDTNAYPAVSEAEILAPSRPVEAERRHLTVMFCDLVGSTAMSQDLDPEDMRDVIRSYQNTVAGEIVRYEGHVAKFMGDGVMAFFGYPQAHEDDPERAIRSGLSIVTAVPSISVEGKKGLQVRVGIATGQVVVGDLVGEGAAQEEAVVGDTPNMAARLQAKAAANFILISDETRELAGNAFDYTDIGLHTLKGLNDPARIWQVEGERVLESRFEAQTRQWTTFVGREHEVGLLLERWQRAKDGEGQVVLLSGEAGIGKSRILETLSERLSTETHTRLRYQCSPFHTNSALYPVIGQMERAASFVAGDSGDAKITKLEQLLAPTLAQLEGAMPLFARLLSLPTERYPPLDATPQQIKTLTLQALLQQLSELAQQQSVLFLFEDAHWIDPTTLELLELLVERIADQRVLVVITYRPEFEAPWQRYDHVSIQLLNRLSGGQCIEMVLDLTHGKPLPDEVLDQIVAKTDGVPLFVEELTKTVLESSLIKEGADRFDLTGPLLALAIPNTLQDSLMARLDRLAPIKEVAQIGAVIGREFTHRLISAASSLEGNELEDALAQLAEAELIFKRGQGTESRYAFKHALVQDVAYESLLKKSRQQLHQRIADVLERDFPTIVESEPETLAHHFTEAGLAEPAIANWYRAGQLAAQRAANLEAIQYFERALALLPSLPEDAARNATELKVLTHLGPALMVVKGWAAAEVGTVYERANKLAVRLESSAELAPPLVGIWLYHNARGRYDLADALTEQLFHVAKTTSDNDLLLQAHHAAWPIPMFRGAFEASHKHIEEGLSLYDQERHKDHALLYMGHDPAVCAHACGSQALWALGLPDHAERHATQALELARQLSHAPTLAFSLWYVSGARAARGDVAAVLSAAEELLSLSREQKLVQTEASAQFFGGWAMALTGQANEGLERMRVGFDIWNPTGMRTWLQMFTTLYADALLHGRRYDEALDALDKALEYGRQTGERWWESRIHHLCADALIHSGQSEAAVNSLQTAIQVAQGQNAKSWELRASMRLARLRAEQGKRKDARDLLAPIYDWFTEGFDTADLKDAKALLNELS